MREERNSSRCRRSRLSCAAASRAKAWRAPHRGKHRSRPRERERRSRWDWCAQSASLIFHKSQNKESECPKGAATYPKDPAVLKTLRDSEVLRRSVFTKPRIFTTVWTPVWGKKCLQHQGNGVSTGGVAIANHCAIVKLLRIVNSLRRSIFSTAGSFG